MGMPAQLTLTGATGTLYWVPDWMQNPFSVGLALTTNASTNGTAEIDVTFQSIDPLQANGTAAANATWFPALQFANATALTAVANWTTPVQAFRLNVSSAVATSLFTAYFVQATYGR